jgi:phosphoglycolate phosphatase
MASHPFRLVVFDCDGTLVDSQHAIVAAMTEACRGLGLAVPSAAATRRVIGPTLEQAVQLLFPDCDAATVAEVAARYRLAAQALRREGAYDEPLFPGVREALEALEGPAVSFGIATGRNRRGLMHTLGNHGLRSRFATLQTPDTCPSKPHPEMLERAMAEAGTLPEETVFIGDTSFDMLMARNAGTAAVWAGWGYHAPAELIGAGADAVAEVPEALPVLLGALERTA